MKLVWCYCCLISVRFLQSVPRLSNILKSAFFTVNDVYITFFFIYFKTCSDNNFSSVTVWLVPLSEQIQQTIATDKALFSSKKCWYLSYFSIKTYVVLLIRSEALLMSTHNICIHWKIRKILCGYPLLSVAMADNKMGYFSYFPKKTGYDISCKLSPAQTICMKCQTLFAEKKENISTYIICWFFIYFFFTHYAKH